MSQSENEKIVNSAIDTEKQSQPDQQQTEMVTIPRNDYESLVKASMLSLQNTFNTLDDFDSILASLMNVQIFVMNLKDAKKKSVSGIKNNSNNNSDKPIEQ